jgi:hypothetical protein
MECVVYVRGATLMEAGIIYFFLKNAEIKSEER